MKTVRHFLFVAVCAMCVPFSAMAETYLIDPSATQSGATISYRNINFTVGTTAFASFAEFNAAGPVSSSTVYVAPGTYDGATISTYGLKVLGANAFCDWNSRGAESSLSLIHI